LHDINTILRLAFHLPLPPFSSLRTQNPCYSSDSRFDA
jgi:hypothetical protein